MAGNTYFEFDLIVTRGDSRTIPIEFYDDAGDAEDVTGWDFFYTAKESLTDTDEEAVISLDPLDIVPYSTNKIQIILTNVMTDIEAKEYLHDIQVVNTAGVTTLMKGKLIIEQDVTNRTAALP